MRHPDRKVFDPNRPTVPEVQPLADRIRASPGGAVGCCLWISLENGNMTDADLRYCLQNAQENCHPDCELLARLLLLMTGTQRSKIA